MTEVRCAASLMLGIGISLAACQKSQSASPLRPTGDIVAANEDELRDAFEAAADDAERNGFSGVALLGVGDEIEVVTPFGLADREAQRSVDTDTAFLIGSITKQVTAGLMLRLHDRGDVDLHTGAGAYLPELHGDKADITIHQLLTHTSGLPESFGGDDELLTQTMFLERVDAAELSPRGEYLYSNVGATLAAIVAERITGVSYEQAVQSVLLSSAGITSLGTTAVAWTPQQLAVGYDGDERWGTILDLPTLDDGPGYNLRGNGGLLSTAEAMHAWTRALVGDELLSDESKEAMFTRYVRTDNGEIPVFAGYGWNLLDWPSGPTSAVATHSGSNGIFYAYTLFYLEEDVHLYVAVSTGEQQGVFAVRAFRTLVNNWLEHRE